MGRSSTPTFRLETTVDRGGWTPQAWRTKEYGRPTLKNLERWVGEMEKSTRAGGVNALIGATTVIDAKIVHQETGDVVCSYENHTVLC